MTTKTHLALVASVDRIASALTEQFEQKLRVLCGTDRDVDHAEWHVYRHVSWEAGHAANVDMPGLFVTVATRQLLLQGETGKLGPHGPDINVGLCLHCHRERIESAQRLGAYATEVLWDIATEMGYQPHVHTQGSSGQPGSNDWIVCAAVLFGPVDGAPTGDQVW